MMIITKKDKKLILLISSTIIVIWFIYLSISSILSAVAIDNTNLKNLTNNANLEADSKWLNSARNITASDLKNRIILVDFWTYSCVSCLQLVPEIKKLEAEFGDKLTIIGVHSSKFQNDKEIESIKKAIIKYDITNPVINDSNSAIWKSFNISALPTIVLIDPKGKISKKYQGNISGRKISEDVQKLIKKYHYSLNHNKLPIVLEKNKTVESILKFPSGIGFAHNFSYKNIAKTNGLIISNTSRNTIMIVSLDGTTLLEIGSGNAGSDDGDIANASFNFPHGLLFKDNVLYVADTGNHLLRKVDFATGEVATIIGTGKNGSILTTKNTATTTSLSSPWDIKFFPDTKHIIISNSGTNQLLKYNIANNIIEPFAGNGELDLIDGTYPNNSLAQPSGLSVASGNLYFVDPGTSSLRVSNKEGVVKTIIGKGVFSFGHKNGTKEEALMQHPIGLSADDTGIYIVDTYNHLIRRFDFKTNSLSDYSGDFKGDKVGDTNNTSYNAPEAMVAVLDKFYIADTNNNRIIELARNGRSSKLLNIIPITKLPKEGLAEYLPNLATIPSKKVKSDSEINLSFDMNAGWKINQLAPSFFNLVEIKNNKEANLIVSFDGETIKSGKVKLPKLSKKYTYYLQGTVYYCEDKKDAICLVKSYEQELIPVNYGSDQINIKFIYQ